MTLTKLSVAVAFVAAALSLACGGGRGDTDGGTGGGAGGGGCIGACGGGAGGGTGGGAGGGTGGGAGGGAGGGGGGFLNDGGTADFTVANLRPSANFGQKVRLNNVVVVSVGDPSVGSQGDSVFDMWVADQGDPSSGIFIAKTFFDPAFYSDGGAFDAYVPVAGDIVTVEGVFGRFQSYNNNRGSRMAVGSGFDMVTNNVSTILKVTFQSSGAAPLAQIVTAPFGDAMAGTVRPNPERAGVYVTIPGPITITNARPTAMERYVIQSGVPTRVGWNGFEVGGNGFSGVLVADRYTDRFRDAGAGLSDNGCDYLSWAQDAGTTSVTFSSISGVWDTYTHAYCQDGGTRVPGEYIGSGQCRNVAGHIPGTVDAGYTYVLFPTRCAQDLPGTVQ